MSRVAWFNRGLTGSGGTLSRRVHKGRRPLRFVMAVAVTVPLLSVPGAIGPALAYASAPAASPGAAVSGVATATTKKITPKDGTKTAYVATATTWPQAGTATVTVALPGKQAQAAKASAPGSAVWAQAVPTQAGSYTGPSSVAVNMLAHQDAASLGVSGVVFSVDGSGGSGSVRVGLDTAPFAQAYGGNYGSRLKLVQLPACALTTPTVAACRVQTPVDSTVDTKGQSVSAVLTLGGHPALSTMSMPATGGSSTPTVLAATDSTGQEGGQVGNYAATALKAEGSWAQGGNSGSFTYSYPISVAPASSAMVPTVSLGYDSGSVDGQTVSTNAQSSWIGDGWGMADSYVEQSFIPCSDDPEGSASPVSTGDDCYDGQILTLSLDGSSTSLVAVYNSSTGTYTYTPADDNGETVTHVTGSGNGSGTYNTDYWVITDQSGVKYEFGLNELPGWVSGDPVTDSVDTEPVYSAHSGDPCYSSSGFTASVCTTAYRWHLDYVVDPEGNAMSYYYDQATNYYGQDLGAHETSYVRDSYLDHIDYGFKANGAYGTVPDKVVFTTAARCTLSTCDPLSASTAGTEYPDVPFDLICASGTTCTSYGPSMFSTVRLTTITSEQYSTASSSYAPIDSYALTQSEPATGDGSSPTLWLGGITHTGGDTSAGPGGAITLPATTFAGIDLPNRVDTTNFPGLYRYRISAITSEMGAYTAVTYGLPTACTPAYVQAQTAATASSNTQSCYPVYWTPPNYAAPLLDWFNKYAVTQVLTTDTTGGGLTEESDYVYSGGAAWHYDDNELTKAQYRTYGQFRGYASVETLTGQLANNPQTESVTTYYRGMDGDYLSPTTTRSVSLTDSQGGVHTDTDQLAGDALETTAYLGAGGPVDHSTITSYWISAPVATRTRTGLPPLTATMTQIAEVFNRQAVTDGGTTTWQYTETDSSYDATATDPNFGLSTYTYNHTVPAVPAYDSCAGSTYAPANTTLNIVGLVASSEADSVACSGFTEASAPSAPAGLNTLGAPTTVNRPAQVQSAIETFYDDPTFSTTFPQTTAPTIGKVTMTRKASTYASGAFTWQTETRNTYDTYGRAAQGYDANGNLTTNAYTLNSVGLTTGETVTSPVVNGVAHVLSETIDPTRNLVLTSTDQNGVVATTQYDALGRTTAVWTNSRPITSPANDLYAYTVSDSGLSGTVTQKLNDESGYVLSVSILDSLGRARQTQTPTPQGGRLITDSFYDSRGWVYKTNTAYWDPTTTPTLALATVLDVKVPDQDDYVFDGLGRTVVDNSEEYSVIKQATTTVYNGDQTTVIPPAGGIAQSTITDPLGRTVKLLEYTTPPTLNTPTNTFTGIWSITAPAGTYTTTTYGYDSHGDQTTTTDNAGSIWTSTYNLLGQVTAKSDPDAGTSTLWYDANGNLTQTEDARGDYTSTTYDALNRQTATYAAATTAQTAGPSGNQIDAWVYDNANNAVSGMTYPIGNLTTATSYTGGYAYVEQSAGFNVFGESLGESVIIPSAAQGTTLGKTWKFTYTYSPTTGLPGTANYPLGGGLPSEIVTDTYATALDLPSGVGDTSYGYAQQTTYTAYGQVEQESLGASLTTNAAYVTDTYDPHTGALKDQLTTRSTTTPSTVDDEAYTYDQAGNITAQTNTRLGATATAETQCYQYDGLDRLTQDWTALDACAGAPTTGTSGTVGDLMSSASTYWTSWTYNAAGERATQDQHALTTGATDTTTAYTYGTTNTGCTTTPGTHTLTKAATTGGATATNTYCYDANGNATTRDTPTDNQSLTWNNQGQLTAVTGQSTGASYIYDAEGTLLIQKDSGSTILYLPGQQITLNTTTNTTTGTRYLALPGGATVVRTGSGSNYNFEISDQNGTATLTLDSTAQVPTWRQFTPYGAPRGTTTTWIDNRGFLDKTTDPTTGLTDVGAREYDPGTGAFISLDPVFEATDPQQLNGYDYAGNNPVTNSDPSGQAAGPTPTNGAQPGVGGVCNSVCMAGAPAAIAATTASVNAANAAAAAAAKAKKEQQLAAKISAEKEAEAWLTKFMGYADACHSGESAAAAAGDLPTASVILECNSMDDMANGTGTSGWGALLTAAGIGVGAMICLVPGVDDVCAVAAEMSMTGGVSVTLEAVLAVGGAGVAQGGIALGGGWAGDILGGDLSGALGLGQEEISDDSALLSAMESCNSFSGATPVFMADGSSKPIDQIKIGDKIANGLPGEDPGTQDQTHTVTAIHVTYTDYDYTNVTINTSTGPQSITGTAHHLYWDITQHAWTQANQMHVGDQLQTTNGDATTILALRNYTSTMVTYNLTIDDLHTYYVEAGSTPVLVHNSATCPTGVGDVWNQGTFDSSEDSFLYHFAKHGAPLNVTPEQYLQDSTAWSGRLTQPGGKIGLNAQRMNFGDGQFGVKYTDPTSGMGGIIGPDGKVVSFWYNSSDAE